MNSSSHSSPPQVGKPSPGQEGLGMCVGMRSEEAPSAGGISVCFLYHFNLTDQALVPPGTKLRGLGEERQLFPE